MSLQAFHITLRICRLRAGWKQEYCAAKLRVGLSTYQAWEQGRRLPLMAARERLEGLFPDLSIIVKASGNA
jgi:transcriptional regulator with XRE-family HTH domain